MTGRFLLTAFLLAALTLRAQQPGLSPDEEFQLRKAVTEAGNSPVDIIRALERHLEKFPETPKRKEIYRALAKGAMETKDDKRMVRYGELVLQNDPSDLQVLERTTRSLLVLGGKENAAKALGYAKRYEEGIRQFIQNNPATGRDAAKIQDDVDRGLAVAYLLQSRAGSVMGRWDEAAEAAGKSFQVFPAEAAAREMALAFEKLGKLEEALPHFADALMIPDVHATDSDRAFDRARLGELYQKLKGSEKGLGDLVLAAWDRTTALVQQRKLALRALDPNSEVGSALDFTISNLEGGKLAMTSLRGKVVVMDFWATWCTPCRAQHPLYEQVKKKFERRDDVVFLAISTDEEHEVVKPFLEAQKWPGTNVYFDDGLGRFLKVSSIPSTIIFNKQGQLASRMDGYLPDRFVDMLTERIDSTLKGN